MSTDSTAGHLGHAPGDSQVLRRDLVGDRVRRIAGDDMSPLGDERCDETAGSCRALIRGVNLLSGWSHIREDDNEGRERALRVALDSIANGYDMSDRQRAERPTAAALVIDDVASSLSERPDRPDDDDRPHALARWVVARTTPTPWKGLKQPVSHHHVAPDGHHEVGSSPSAGGRRPQNDGTERHQVHPRGAGLVP
jgi:hypothetical protein